MKNVSQRSSGEALRKMLSEEPSLVLSEEELQSIIDAELSKEEKEVDGELIYACSQALSDMRGMAYTATDEQKAEHKRQLYNRISNQHKKTRRNIRRVGLRIAASFAALMVVAFASELFLDKKPYTIYHSPDQEEFIIEGREPDEFLIAGTNAQYEDIEHSVFETNDLEEGLAYLGYTPILPAFIPEGVTFAKISIMRDSDSDTVVVRYRGENKRQVIYTYERYRNMAYRSTAIEQSEIGRYAELQSGRQIYVARNIDKPWALLIVDNEWFNVAVVGFDEDTLLKIMESIGV